MTSEPRRLHTLPISSPIIPPPITTFFLVPSGARAHQSSQQFALHYFDGTTGKWRNLGPGSDDHILRFHGGLATLVELHRDRVRRHKGGSSFDVVNFNLLEEKLNALGEALDGIILHLEQMGEVQFDSFDWRRLFFR